MNQFRFAINRKITSWERGYFTIEAATEKEAKEIAKQMFYNEDSKIECEEYEELVDTIEEMSIEENFGEPTLELMEKGKLGWECMATNKDNKFQHD